MTNNPDMQPTVTEARETIYWIGTALRTFSHLPTVAAEKADG